MFFPDISVSANVDKMKIHTVKKCGAVLLSRIICNRELVVSRTVARKLVKLIIHKRNRFSELLIDFNHFRLASNCLFFQATVSKN